ncbi:hypothetical protein [Lichenicoccus sp.]|uniref:hypothetical protein n=1 Tax=Lichenicoccus sp. TaxID=2781899 RepID=UPI003D0A117C
MRAAAAARGLRVAAVRDAGAALRFAIRDGAALAVRGDDRVVAFVARVVLRMAVRVVAFVDLAFVAPVLVGALLAADVLRTAALAATLRPGAARVEAARFVVVARFVVARFVVARVAAALVVRFAGALAVRVAPALAAAGRDVADLPPSFLAAADRAAGVLAVLVVRATELRLPVPAVRRPPAFTAIALARGLGVFELSSVLIVWPFHSPV